MHGQLHVFSLFTGGSGPPGRGMQKNASVAHLLDLQNMQLSPGWVPKQAQRTRQLTVLQVLTHRSNPGSLDTARVPTMNR
mmetsp:Transcript_10500/g.19350  ORF Transcript_10500/g.19350 Transcript_10500/m.19350 type:complete len:80 (-) Transcript_10500:229-468(-)